MLINESFMSGCEMNTGSICQIVFIDYEDCIPVNICENCEGWKPCKYQEGNNAVNFFYDVVNSYVVLDNNKLSSIIFEFDPDFCKCDL